MSGGERSPVFCRVVFIRYIQVTDLKTKKDWLKDEKNETLNADPRDNFRTVLKSAVRFPPTVHRTASSQGYLSAHSGNNLMSSMVNTFIF